jgi:hypothetical protein
LEGEGDAGEWSTPESSGLDPDPCGREREGRRGESEKWFSKQKVIFSF